ncbi:MAG: porin [Flavipsychrobacter sp.]|jgi:aquaporin Z|nr:porin [Flavipsychrobacter sp.]
MKKFIAEFIGTLVLVLLGCGAAVIAGKTLTPDVPAGIGLLGISIAFGIAVVAMAYAIGPVSGCHINPAVTVSMLVAGKIKMGDAIGYIIAQFVGATAGAGLLYIILQGNPAFAMGEWALGANGWGPGYLGSYNMVSAFISEAVLTFIFLFVIHAVTSKAGNSTMAGLAIGLTLVLIHLVGIPVTGVSVNPARSFGPAIFAQGLALQQLWLFLAAPVLGGILAAIVWQGIFAPPRSVPVAKGVHEAVIAGPVLTPTATQQQ